MMSRQILAVCVVLVLMSEFVYSQAGTEIYLLDLGWTEGRMVLSNPQNVTNHPGYDNQPFFHPDNPVLYYSSDTGEGRTDIMECNYSTGETKRITQTPEREYSPTVTPDKKFLSCIVQRDDGAQDLCKYPIDGGAPVTLINTLKIGYHAWADEMNVMLFVLGEPNTLHWYTFSQKKEIRLMEGIGRSLHRIPGTRSISFVHKFSDEYWSIKKIREEDGQIVTVAETLPEREDLAWTPDGKIVMSDGSKIFFLQPGKNSSWKEADLQTTLPSGAISRLAVSPKGDRIAVVVNE